MVKKKKKNLWWFHGLIPARMLNYLFIQHVFVEHLLCACWYGKTKTFKNQIVQWMYELSSIYAFLLITIFLLFLDIIIHKLKMNLHYTNIVNLKSLSYFDHRFKYHCLLISSGTEWAWVYFLYPFHPFPKLLQYLFYHVWL
jgi:hypothetical protein